MLVGRGREYPGRHNVVYEWAARISYMFLALRVSNPVSFVYDDTYSLSRGPSSTERVGMK